MWIMVTAGSRHGPRAWLRASMAALSVSSSESPRRILGTDRNWSNGGTGQRQEKLVKGKGGLFPRGLLQDRNWSKRRERIDARARP